MLEDFVDGWKAIEQRHEWLMTVISLKSWPYIYECIIFCVTLENINQINKVKDVKESFVWRK